MRLLPSRTRLKLSIVPVAIGTLLLFVPWFFFMWNVTVAAVIPAVKFRTNHTLAGIVQQAGPELSFESFRSYKYQTFVSRLVGEMSPIYKPAIRWKNQIYFSLFGMSGTPSLVVGPGKQIYQTEYLKEFCARDPATFETKATAWVQQIRKMQDFFEARGKTFVYVVTPSKPAVYPEIVPYGYSCPGGLADRGAKLRAWERILTAAGIHFVDAAKLVADARAAYPIPMFPRGGVHWNRLAASLGAQALTEEVNRFAGREILTPFRIDWRSSYEPDASDRDVLDVLNLRFPDRRYEVADVIIRSGARESCRPARITEVGGSFLFLLNDALVQAQCPPRISDWFYWERTHFRFPGGTLKPLPVVPEERAQALLEDSDVVIYEENEAVTPEANHGLRLLEFMASRAM